MTIDRRNFLKSSAVLGAVKAFAADAQRYQVGISNITGGGWEKDLFLSYREAREVGFHYVETHVDQIQQLGYYPDKPRELQQKMDEIGLKFANISNGPPLNTHFDDPTQHQKIFEDYLQLIRFNKNFGLTHLKINPGPRRPTGTSQEDLKYIADGFEGVGRRLAAEGVKFAPHPHLGTHYLFRNEIDFVMKHTDPKHVWMTVDTGHITMAGMDVVELARAYGHRVVEFHLKDTKRETLGGSKTPLENGAVPKYLWSFPLGTSGGVDFVGLKAHLDEIAWKGWMVVELETATPPERPPKVCARISKQYLEQTLKLMA